MNLKRRQKLLAIARWMDRRSAAIRKYVAANTPKRARKRNSPEAERVGD